MIIKSPLEMCVIDDDLDFLNLIEFYLKGQEKRLHLSKFTNPVQALEYMKENDVNIALVDINMNEMTGDELLNEINQLKRGTRVILTSATKSMINLITCFQGGAFDFLIKPVSNIALNESLVRVERNLTRWENILTEIHQTK